MWRRVNQRLTSLLKQQQRLKSSGNLPELTKNRNPDVQRGPYAQLNGTHFQFFKELLGENRVLHEADDCEPYNIDWIRNDRGYSNCVLKPKTTEEVSKILSYCNDNNLAVCPQGGNTGLVAGSIPIFDEVVLSMRSMDRIISVDTISGIAVCEAGCVLERLDDHLAGMDLMVPLDLGAKGSCCIGGNVATNAGGLRLLRYGNLHGSVLGVEAVKANGEVIDCLSTLKKDNTGFHLKHLFIGSEGLLGVVTKVSIKCPPKPKAVHVAFLGLNTFDDLLGTFVLGREHLGEILSSFELIDAQSLDVVTTYCKKTNPLRANYAFYVLLETHGSDARHDAEKIEMFLGEAMERKLVGDGTLTSDLTKMKEIWFLRENITQGLLHDGYVFKYDFSLPINDFYKIVHIMEKRMGADAVRVCGYGHVGDSNIHVNVSIKEYDKSLAEKVEPFIYQQIGELNGSVSAEHGLGFRKRKYLRYSKSESAVRLMRQLKNVFDPKGILNPYKVLL